MKFEWEQSGKLVTEDDRIRDLGDVVCGHCLTSHIFMKTLFVALVGVLLLSGNAHCQVTEIHVSMNAREQTAEVFKAPTQAVNKTLHWRLGIDEDFLPQKALIEIARKNAKLPGKEHEIDDIVGVDWRRIDLGWMVTVHFSSTVRRSQQAGTIPIKDGGVFVAVPLLPNGEVVTTETRPLTVTEKESLQQESRSGTIDDPFTSKKPLLR